MKTRPFAFALLLALAPAATLPPRPALAQAVDETTTKMARQRFQEGVAFYDKGQFEMARAAFLQAYALRKHPTVLINLAQSCLKSGHALEAARDFQQFLKEYSSATEAQRADAIRGLGEARMKLGRIDLIGATVGADVFVDDERIGMAPLDHSVDVEPGTHTVRSQGPNGEQSISVTANAGQGATAKFASAAVAAAPPPAAAPTETAAEPAQPAPPPPSPEPAPAPPAAIPEERGDRPHHWGWVAASAAVTVAGAVTAGIFAKAKSDAQNSANGVAQDITNDVIAVAKANGTQPQLQGTCNPPGSRYVSACSALTTDNNNVNADATIANVGIAVGVIGLAGLIVSVVVTARSYHGGSDSKQASSPSRVKLAPVFSKEMNGMNLSVSF